MLVAPLPWLPFPGVGFDPCPDYIGTQSRVLLACEITNGSAVMGVPFGMPIGEVAPCPPLTACYCGFRKFGSDRRGVSGALSGCRPVGANTRLLSVLELAPRGRPVDPALQLALHAPFNAPMTGTHRGS